MRWIFVLADRTSRNPSLELSLISNLSSRSWDPTQDHLIVVGLCDVGLHQARDLTIQDRVKSACGMPRSTQFRFVTKQEARSWQQ